MNKQIGKFNASGERVAPYMLYEVLRDEYKLLDILDDADLAAIEKYKQERGEFHKIEENFERVKAMSRAERARQFSLRQLRRFEVLRFLRERFHKATERRPVTAICLSGGGIRSATFCLGVIQSLAKNKLLDKFDYLSTVSGGGYIGSWLSAWIARFDLETVQKKLCGIGLAEGEVEAQEIKHLRTYSNYMSPRTGLFSTDTWTLIAVYLRNLLLNWAVIVPTAAAILLLPRLFVSLLTYDAGYRLADLTLSVATLSSMISICCINMMRPSLGRYSYFSQNYKTDDIGTVIATRKVLLWCVIPILLFAIGLTVTWTWTNGRSSENGIFVLSGYATFLFIASYVSAWLIMLRNFVRFWKSPEGKQLKKDLQEDRCTTRKQGVFWTTTRWLKSKYKTYLSESVLSVISGIVGGALLFMVSEKILPAVLAQSTFVTREEFMAAFGVPLVLLVFLISATLFTGLAVRITDDDDREWMTRFGAVLLKVIVAWSLIVSTVIFGPKLVQIEISTNWDSFIKGAGAFIAILSGLFSVISGFSSKTPSDGSNPAGDRSGLIITIASSIAAPIFVLFLLISVALASEAIIAKFPIAPGFNHTAWAVAFAAIGIVMGWFININKFSIHSSYRERLIRAYLGASNANRLETANSFTGLNTEKDNIEMTALSSRPLHVVNMTLNLVKAKNLAWQNRKAESFTATKLHSGSSQMGASGNYRSSECYGFNKQNRKAITLGTAAAISGAAASPNMGYFTQSTAVSLLMTLFNVRLGWWLGNPGQRGMGTWKKAAPLWSTMIFLREAFGLTDDTGRYVYLADGGQFENLGLYEMVLRRCNTIVLCDAASDPKHAFYDLGAAIHKIRVDMGIPIEFENNKNPEKGKYGAIAHIKYTAVDGNNASDGTLIYIKPTLNGTEPINIQHYKSANPSFPHETTADQFYSEAQFESYRSLGFNIMDELSKGAKLRNLDDLITNVRSNR